MKFFKKIKLFNNKKKLIRNTKIFSLIIFVLSFGLITFVFSEVQDNMSGFGWSASYVDLPLDGNTSGEQDDNEVTGGMGWLSFNCKDEQSNFSTCSEDNNNYGVNIDENGNLIGLAWSPNYGWLKFGGLTGMPNDGENAKFVGTINQNGHNGELQGFARFCAPADEPNPDDCSGFEINNSNGGWDGWVKLDGENYGVIVQYGELSGFGWGGNGGDILDSNFVGWIDFDGIIIKNPIVVSLSASQPNVNESHMTVPLTFIATLSPSSVATDTIVTLDYSGSAQNGQDYGPINQYEITIPAGSTSASITTFYTKDDTEDESDESIIATITNVSSGSGVVINDSQKTDFITIIDDDEGGGNPPGGTGGGGKPKYKEN